VAVVTEIQPEPLTGDVADPGMLELASQLCFALYSTSRSMTAAYRPFLDRMGITYPQYFALLALWERPDVTMKELGEQLRLDYGTVSPLIQRLIAHGLVESVRSSTDGRAVVLRATDASTGLRHQAVEMLSAVLAGIDYSIDEVISLREQVNGLGERLDAYIAGRHRADS
jgi:DNA-binding MarR family transcriptional regulator